MKKLNLSTLVLSGVFILLLSSCRDGKKNESQNTAGQEEQKSAEIAPKVIFENDYAKVAKIRLAPRESQPSHEGASRVIYSLTNYSIDWEEQGKKLGTKKWKKGDVHFHKAGKHAAKNNGTSIAEWLVFSKKNTDLPECGENQLEDDVNSVSAEFAQILFDNDEFRITQIKLPKGGSIPTHSGINRIIYSLSDYDIKYESDAKGKVDKQFKIGDVHWHEACKHNLKNNGETEANFLVVSYKKMKE